MATQLKRTYFCLLIPAITGVFIAFLCRSFNLFYLNAHDLPDLFSPAIFILSVVFAAALPILYRTLFANRIRRKSSVSETDWLKFEKNLIRIALITPYLAALAYFLQIPKFHFTGTTLAALYAIYYFYPTKNRIAFEKRIFRVTK